MINRLSFLLLFVPVIAFSQSNDSTIAYDYGYRMYDARIGKAVSTDPIQPKNNSPYSFATQNKQDSTRNPLNKTDNNGLKQGLWKEPLQEDNFSYLLVNYVKNVKSGQFKAFDKSNNIIIEGFFKTNLLDSLHKEYYPSGVLKTLSYYTLGKLNGEQIEYWENTNIKTKSYYKNDTLNVLYISYYETGTKWVEYEIKNGIAEGEYKHYHKNGKIWFKGKKSNDKKDGKWFEYDTDGSLIKTTLYKNGVLTKN